MLDDTELLRRFAEEADEGAFARFVERHAGVVLGSAARRVQGDEHRAREIAQQVFVAAARQAEKLARHRCVTGWLFTTTRNAALNLMREEQRRARWERAAATATEPAAMAPGAADDGAWAEVRPLLDEAIDGLGERDREAVLLRYFSALPLAEIGRRLGVSENAARMRVQRALERLHGSLARRGVTSSATVLGGVLSARASATVPADLAGAWAHAACAGAAQAVAGGAALTVGFMGAWKTAGGIAGLALFVCGAGWVGWEWRGLRAARGELAREQARVLALERNEASERARRVAAESRMALLRAERAAAAAAGAPSSSTVTTASAPAVNVAWDAEREGNALMERHPGLAEAVRARSDAMMRFRFAPTLERLGATPQQIEGFIRLQREGSAISAPFGPKGEHYSFHAGDGLTREEQAKQRRELLGDGLMARMDEVFRRADARGLTYDLAAALTFTDMPLTAVQAQAMETVLFESLVPKQGVDWTKAQGRAKGLLAPEQQAALARVSAADLERKKQTARRNEAAGDAKGGTR